MATRVIKVYPKVEELQKIANTLSAIQNDLMTYRYRDQASRDYLVSTCAVEISNQVDKLKSVYESKA